MKQQLNRYSKALQSFTIAGLSSISLASHAENQQTEQQNTPYKHFCHQQEASEHWLDKTQAQAYSRTCKAVSWFDNLFGDEETFDDKNFRGKITVGFRQDERDGFDPRVRLRIKSKLPNVSKRLNAFIGRVDEDSYVSDSRPKQDSVVDSGIRSDDQDEAEWLIGLGYSNPHKTNSGFDYSLGAKISSGLNPYAKIRYKHLFNMPERHYLRATQTFFWQDDDGYGTTTNLNYTYLLGAEDILEWGVSAKFTEEESQWEWITGTTWFHQISANQGISSRIYIRGEEENTESIPEYGISFTYRTPFLREWLFLETAIENRWVRENANEDRDSSLRLGIQLEMIFGDYYKRRGTSKKDIETK